MLRTGLGFRFESIHLLSRNFGTDHALGGAKPTMILAGDEGASDALEFCAARAADAMCVGLRCVGHIEIDYMGYPAHVDTSRHDVGGH